MPKISVCMIVKNEQLHLANALNSIKDLADEIIVMDTGSTDNTLQIAKDNGAQVYKMQWPDDFSIARNESIKLAIGDWILVLDADETISKQDTNKLKEIINKTNQGQEFEDVDGFILTQRNYIKHKQDLTLSTNTNLNIKEAGQSNKGFVDLGNTGDPYQESKETAGYLPTPIIRLFRNNKGIIFKGAVHEDVSQSITKKIHNIDIPIHHFGKLDLNTWKSKWQLYEKLAIKKANEEKDYYSYFELGRQFLASKKLEQAKEALEKCVELNKDFYLGWFNLGSLNLMEQDLQDAIKHLEITRLINPNFVPIYANLGVAYAQNKQYKKALKIFTMGLNLNVNQPSIFKNMAICYKEMGDSHRSNLAYQKFLSFQKN
jgi:glycosyltransferase involved in cell wall biosynthesis